MPRTVPLIHIGLHKTGTTWLQNKLFADFDAGFSSPWTREEILEQLILVNPLRFDPDALRAHLAPGIQRAEAEERVPVLSHERLSGNPHSGGYDRMLVADRLAGALPDARVLIVIREQISMLASTYKQYVREGGACSIRRYLYPPVQGIARIPLFSFGYFDYDELIRCYVDRFGSERVLVLPYELFRSDDEEFVGRIVRFAGARQPSQLSRERENAGLSAVAVGWKRWLNLLLVRDRVNPSAFIEDPRFNFVMDRAFAQLDRLLPRRVRMAAERRLKRRVGTFVRSRYGESNRRASDLLGFDLREFGYETASPRARGECEEGAL